MLLKYLFLLFMFIVNCFLGSDDDIKENNQSILISINTNKFNQSGNNLQHESGTYLPKLYTNILQRISNNSIEHNQKPSFYGSFDTPATKVNLAECGKTRKVVVRTNRIVGGDKVSIKQFPWIVSFQKSIGGQYEHFCGGAIINSRWIVSAGHCFNGMRHSLRKIRALVGATQWNSTEGIKYELDTLKVHEKFDSFNYANDISLIKTKKPIEMRTEGSQYYVNMICLSTSEIPSPETANVYGWGLVGELDGISLDLMKTTLNKFNTTQCNIVYKKYIGTFTEQMMCYSAPGKDACQGDSGGPLSQKVNSREYLFGLVSFGQGCGRPGIPGIYTNVALYQNWIKTVIEKN